MQLNLKRAKASLLMLCVIGLAGSSILAFGRFATKRESMPQDVTADVREKITALSSTDPVKRAAAAFYLSKKGEAAVVAIPQLVQLLGDDTTVDPNMYRKGEQSDGPKAPKPSPGTEATKALTAIGEPAVDPLIALLKDSNPVARRNAAWGLGSIRDARAVEPLVAVLKDADARVRYQATWALGSLKDDRAVEGLSSEFRDTDPDVREQAAWALGSIRAAIGVDALVGALTDEFWKVREQAAWALGSIKDSRAVDALIGALTDKNPRVRKQAAWALGSIGDLRATDALTVALNDQDQKVREQAVWALQMKARSNYK